MSLWSCFISPTLISLRSQWTLHVIGSIHRMSNYIQISDNAIRSSCPQYNSLEPNCDDLFHLIRSSLYDRKTRSPVPTLQRNFWAHFLQQFTCTRNCTSIFMFPIQLAIHIIVATYFACTRNCVGMTLNYNEDTFFCNNY